MFGKSKNKHNGASSSNNANNNPSVTAVMKVELHCEGCILKINKLVTKTNGFQVIDIDRENDLVTVTGNMDMNALAIVLRKHLKKNVEILPPKKEEKKEKKEEKKENDKAKNGGGENKQEGGGNGNGNGNVAGGGEDNRMMQGYDPHGQGYGPQWQGYAPQWQGYGQQGHGYAPQGYGYPPQGQGYAPHGQGYAPQGQEQFDYNNMYSSGGTVHAPNFFSDENPNACSVM